MKTLKINSLQRLFCLLPCWLGSLFLALGSLQAQEKTLSAGKWQLIVNEQTKTVSLEKNGFTLSATKAAFRLADKNFSTDNYRVESVKKTSENGQEVITVLYVADNLPRLTRKFYASSNDDFLETEMIIESHETLSSNFLAPLTMVSGVIFGGNTDCRALFVPFDNDKWGRFQSHKLNFDKLTSYEATAIFNNTSREGLVLGSVEHDRWKTAVEMRASGDKLTALLIYGGAADELTRDSRPHGAVSGKIIKSPRIFVGHFADWRTGLETFADANAAIAPPRAWNKAVPFGWNSWGVLQFNLNYEKAIQVSDFFKNNLQNNHFVNTENTLYIGLDSGWNSFTEEQLKDFVKKCKENGQQAGVYWTPFTDWGKHPERSIKDAPEYKYSDVYLYANGLPQTLDGAYAIDPTHPAIEAQMKTTSELFRRCGFTYVKMDFMTHGALESDHWYKPEIATGIEAYNYGMTLLNKYFGDMFINLSISPIFPAHYAQSRRIACDAWNKIKDTEYTLNALSYGWWLDRVYQYNDADHVVLQQATDGENRARVTSAVITGLYIAGDDFSLNGTDEGKNKARKFLTNKEVNGTATGVSFRPLEGNGEKSENQFIRSDKNGNVYYAVFNYSEKNITLNIPFQRIGIDPQSIKTATELWSGEKLDINKPLNISEKDVKFIKFEKR